MMTPVQEANVRCQEVARMRMDQARERAVDAMNESWEAWERAEFVFQAAAKEWQEAVREGAESANR
jgi:hypothetical protein